MMKCSLSGLVHHSLVALVWKAIKHVPVIKTLFPLSIPRRPLYMLHPTYISYPVSLPGATAPVISDKHMTYHLSHPSFNDFYRSSESQQAWNLHTLYISYDNSDSFTTLDEVSAICWAAICHIITMNKPLWSWSYHAVSKSLNGSQGRSWRGEMNCLIPQDN